MKIDPEVVNTLKAIHQMMGVNYFLEKKERLYYQNAISDVIGIVAEYKDYFDDYS